MDQDPTSDAYLLSRIKRREPEALGELYDRYGKRAYAIVLRIVHNEETAENLLAETFVTVWNQVARWRDTRFEDLHLWLFLLARNHAIEYLRSRNEPLPKAIPRPTALIQPNVLQDFPRPKDAEAWDRFRDAFANLTDKELHILEMACFDGVPVSEIAVTSGESVGSIKETIRLALQRLEHGSGSE